MNAITNKTNKTWKTGAFLILAAMVLVFAATALAQGTGGRSGHGQGKSQGICGGEFGSEHRMEMLQEKLELTDEQVAAIEKIRETGRENGAQLQKEMMRLRNELEGEMLKDEPSEKTVLNLVGEIGDLKTEAQTARMKNRLEVARQLTPEQRDKMLMMHGSFGHGHGHGSKGGRHGGSRCDHECDGSGPGCGSQGQRG